MSEMGDYWRDVKRHRRELRAELGVDCPKCKINRPRTNPSKLLPGARCRVDGYVDPRPRRDAEE